MGLLGFSCWLFSCVSVFLMHLQAVGAGPLVLLHETSGSMLPLALCMPPRCFSLYLRLLMSALGLQVEELELARLSWCLGSQVSGLHFLCKSKKSQAQTRFKGGAQVPSLGGKAEMFGPSYVC